MILPIQELSVGDRGEVVEVSGNEILITRLAERGLKVGSKLEAILIGDPCLVMVDDVKLSLRVDQQVAIMVRSDD